MFKQCRILNKNTNENYFGQIDTEFEGKDFYELVEIPKDEKQYIWQDREIKDKPPYVPTLDELKTQDNLNANDRFNQGIFYKKNQYDYDTKAQGSISSYLKLLSTGKYIDIPILEDGTPDIKSSTIKDYTEDNVFVFIDFYYKPQFITHQDLINIDATGILLTAKIMAKNAQNQKAESLTEQDIDYSNI